jgi:hypothetical protein
MKRIERGEPKEANWLSFERGNGRKQMWHAPQQVNMRPESQLVKQYGKKCIDHRTGSTQSLHHIIFDFLHRRWASFPREQCQIMEWNTCQHRNDKLVEGLYIV